MNTTMSPTRNGDGSSCEHVNCSLTRANAMAPDRIGVLSTANELNTVVLKLRALLAMTYGENGESFRSTAADIQDDVLWTCHDMAKDAIELVARLEGELR